MGAIQSYADVVEGASVPEFVEELTELKIIKYCAASDDFSDPHWNHPYMLSRGFPGILGHGWLGFGYMARVVTDWIPPEIADLKEYTIRYSRPMYPGRLTVGGRVLGKLKEDGETLADIEAWLKDENGTILSTAKMRFSFLSR